MGFWIWRVVSNEGCSPRCGKHATFMKTGVGGVPSLVRVNKSPALRRPGVYVAAVIIFSGIIMAATLKSSGKLSPGLPLPFVDPKHFRCFLWALYRESSRYHASTLARPRSVARSRGFSWRRLAAWQPIRNARAGVPALSLPWIPDNQRGVPARDWFSLGGRYPRCGMVLGERVRVRGQILAESSLLENPRALIWRCWRHSDPGRLLPRL